jgi:uncharacterized membrane protein
MSIMSLFNDPHARHAIIVHWPIVMCWIAPVLVLLVALTRAKKKSLVLVAVGCCVVGSVGAFFAAGSGEGAEDSLEMRYSPISAAEGRAVKEHEELAENGWVWPLIPAACLTLCLVPFKPPFARILLLTLALLSSAGVTAWVALTAHAGGTLVYVYGLGVPERGKAEAVQGAGSLDADSR